MKNQKLELTWIGKDNQPKVEPRVLIEDEELSYGDKNTENMLIHGDNLLALKALEEKYTNKIQCICIDPPYNTGSAFEHYDDNLEHSIWLNLMKARLEIMYKLLDKKAGTLWIILDDSEVHYCKVLCDEIFGRNNFLNDIIWNSRKSVSNDAIISLNTNHILVYAMDMNYIRDEVKKGNLFKGPIDSSKFSNPDNDPRGPWVADPFDAPNLRPNLTYKIINPNTKDEYWPPKGRCWRTTEENYKKALSEGRIIFGKTGKSKPQLKRYMSESEEKGSVMTNLWTDVDTTTNATKHSQQLFEGAPFTNPKPENLIERIIRLSTKEGDIVLDSFLGSGTTSAVAHKMNRKWIGIEMGNQAYDYCKIRLDKVINGTDLGGVTTELNWQGGGGYKFYELAPSLLVKDKFDNWIISEKYNGELLTKAVCKQEKFDYIEKSDSYWKQGKSSENDYIFVTTNYISVEYLDAIHEEMQDNESLLICCKTYQGECEERYDNITIKKIPQTILNNCEYGKDDYSLNVNEVLEIDEEDE